MRSARWQGNGMEIPTLSGAGGETQPSDGGRTESGDWKRKSYFSSILFRFHSISTRLIIPSTPAASALRNENSAMAGNR